MVNNVCASTRKYTRLRIANVGLRRGRSAGRTRSDRHRNINDRFHRYSHRRSIPPIVRSFMYPHCLLLDREKGRKRKREREREERRKISRCMHALPLRWDMIESISLINDTSENIREWKFIRSFWLVIESQVVLRAFFFEIFRLVGGFNFRKF